MEGEDKEVEEEEYKEETLPEKEGTKSNNSVDNNAEGTEKEEEESNALLFSNEEEIETSKVEDSGKLEEEYGNDYILKDYNEIADKDDEPRKDSQEMIYDQYDLPSNTFDRLNIRRN